MQPISARARAIDSDNYEESATEIHVAELAFLPRPLKAELSFSLSLSLSRSFYLAESYLVEDARAGGCVGAKGGRRRD